MSSGPPTPSPPPKPGTKIEIRPITSVADIPKLAEISRLALEDDTMFEFRARCGAKSVYDMAIEKLTRAVNNPTRFSMFKAVLVPATAMATDEHDDQKEDEVIVAYTQWMLGYLETPKMYPFAPKDAAAAANEPGNSGGNTSTTTTNTTTFEANISNITTSETTEKVAGDVATALEGIASNDAAAAAAPRDDSKPYYSNPDQDYSRQMGNAYIKAIRGKRHLCLHRLIVHPSYQRQGLGQRLLEWGIETADRENVVSWLFARPAGSKLYERNGWRVHATIPFPVLDEDLFVPPSMAMLRLPGAGKGLKKG